MYPISAAPRPGRHLLVHAVCCAHVDGAERGGITGMNVYALFRHGVNGTVLFADFGVFVDFASMHQKDESGERTGVEDALFRRALGSLELRMSHPRNPGGSDCVRLGMTSLQWR